jgi:hypothetical protein
MDRLQRAAILTELMDRLRNHDNRCGESRLQNAVYFLQEILGVPTNFEYILYKHCPYSFDLSADIVALRADYLVELDHRSPGYGPVLIPTTASGDLRSRYSRTLGKYRSQIDIVAGALGAKDVAELEKLAAALFVSKELGEPGESFDESIIANRIHELKPHVSFHEALDAVREFERIARDARSSVPVESYT